MARAGDAVRSAAAAIAFVFATVLVPARANAHPLDMGYMRLEAGDALSVTLDLDVNVVAQLLHVEPMSIDRGVAAARATELATATYRMQPPQVDGQPCAWTTPAATLRGRSVSLTERVACPHGTATWELPFVKRMSATFQVLAKVRSGTGENVVVIDKSSSSLTIGTGATRSFAAQLWLGVKHLAPTRWSGLVPDGLEHLMLVLALLLAGGSLLQLVKIAGAAIAAQVAAIGLAFAGADPAPGACAVAFPVVAAVVAAAAIVHRFEHRRWIAAAIAGALHGFATAPVLDHSASAFVGFDLGFGFGLLAIVLAVGPPIAHAIRDAGVRRYGVPAVGAVVVLVSLAEIWRLASLA